MPKQSQKKSGGMKKYGRNEAKCARYRTMHTREKNKVRRVLRSNGVEAADLYAREHNLMTYLSTLMAARHRKE